jgi:ABC-type bacteriocin/lantibiotic exporter with double-glycine peptidase domain
MRELAQDAEPALLVRGFDAMEATWRLLRRHGHEGGLQAFREIHALHLSAEALTEPLERAGIQARAAIIGAEELVYLDVPTLLQLKDGSWVLLEDHGGDAVRIEAADGSHAIAVANLTPSLSGYVLDLSPSLPEGAGLFDRLKELVFRQRKALVLLAVASLLLQSLGLVVPELTGMVMNTALPDRAGSTLRVVAVGVVLVAAFQAWIGWLREKVLLYLSTRVSISAERGLLQHLLRLPFPFLDGMTLGERLQAFNGMRVARDVLAERAIAAVLDGALAIAFVVSMALKVPIAAAAVVLVAMVMALVAIFVGSAQARHQEREVAAQASERGYLSELVAGIGTLKAAGAEEQGMRRWLKRFRVELDHGLRRQRLGLVSDIGLDTLVQGLDAALLIWGGSLILKGQLLVGTLFAFVQLSAGFLGAVFGLVRTYLAFVVLRPQLVKTREVLARAPEKRSSRRSVSRAPAIPVVMEDVWFRYGPSRPWILRGYSMRFDAGQKHVLTGPSGFGKSTILRLLAGLYVPEEGSISIGGMSPQAATSDILYLPQFVKLFSGSIAENLRLLSGGMPMAQLLEAAKLTGLSSVVDALPMSYHTLLPPGGGSLSGGQRQLVALTAALASVRKLLLLDEALSNLDPLRSAALRRTLETIPPTVIEARHVV